MQFQSLKFKGTRLYINQLMQNDTNPPPAEETHQVQTHKETIQPQANQQQQEAPSSPKKEEPPAEENTQGEPQQQPAAKEQAPQQQAPSSPQKEETPAQVRPASPERPGISSQGDILSPKSSQSGSRRPQSPGVFKGKLDIVKKFMVKEEEKYAQLTAELTPLTEEKARLEKELEARQNQLTAEPKLDQNSGNFQRQLDELKSKNTELTQKVEVAKKAREDQVEFERLNLLERIKVLNVEIDNKKRENLEKSQQYQSQVAQIRSKVQLRQAQISELAKQCEANSTRKAQIAHSITALEQQRAERLQQIEAANQANEKQINEEKLRAELEAKILQARERINLKKQQMADLKAREEAIKRSDKLPAQINKAKNVGRSLEADIQRLEKEIGLKQTEANTAKEDQKKTQKRIAELRKKIEQSSKKKQELVTQIEQLNQVLDEKKAVKYQQKIPEELLAAKSKNDFLKKQIREINHKVQIQKAEMDRLVPPAVIDNMNKKISTIIANNERYTEVSKIIEEVSRENERLVEEREKLEWGENNYLKELDHERRRQEEKNKALEEDLALKKRNLQQLNSKLEEYVKAYPEFKPEKKKKAETDKTKKEEKGNEKGNKKPTSSVITEEGDRSPKSTGNKKKNAVEHIPRTASEVAIEETKKAGKKKKKSGVTQQIKQETRSQKQEPVKEEVKVEAKKQEVKVESKKQEVKAQPKKQEAKPAEAPKKKKKNKN